MLRAVAELAGRHGRYCEVSIETLMACGVGACLGCAIKDRHRENGYGHVCIDGPVFEASRLQLGGGNEAG
jgi:dihydroorotate dehydrogenase electron transfer subunit